ncbi:MAG: HAMP domain-containing sensor histidine kinase [Candidatus Margulisiibacteriota bacterium]|nr:HAMP domain-containing sensor histidine kinase [Candidatus Margulisiibacteriota bacterium]
MSSRISQSNNLLISRAVRVAARFSAKARETTSHAEVINAMAAALAKAHYADRVSFYHLDPFGNLHAHTGFPQGVIEKSHVQNIAPEGPLATVIEYEGFVYVPTILQPQQYFLSDKHGNFMQIKGNHLNETVIDGYVRQYGENFEQSGENMDMLFGCLSVQDSIFGAFKADAFPSGRSVLQNGMEPEDLLSISAIVSNSAAQSLDELNIRRDLVKEKKEVQTMYDRAFNLLSGFKHAVGGRLTPPLGYTDLLKRTGGLSPKQNGYLEKITRRLRGLDAYLEKYLAPIKEGSLEMKIEKGPTELRLILQPLNDFPRFSVNVDEQVPERIVSDREKISDVIFSLVENAQKYSDPGSPITINVSVTDNQVEIRVIDQGLGLTSNQAAEAFCGGKRFHPEIKGSGWGLHNSRGILQKLGGRIWAESAGIGKGSTFILRLPI